MTTGIAAKGVSYEELVDFLKSKMDLSTIFQPLLARPLIDAGCGATKSTKSLTKD